MKLPALWFELKLMLKLPLALHACVLIFLLKQFLTRPDLKFSKYKK